MLRPTIVTLLCVAALACAPSLQRSRGALSAGQLAELRIARDPEPRDLFADPGLRAAVRPKTDDRFTVVKCDTGFARFTFDGDHQEPSRRVGVEDVERPRGKT
jgi:hypothetical protein